MALFNDLLRLSGKLGGEVNRIKNMVLVCPQCMTACSLAPSALGPGRRDVECHSCGHVWNTGGGRGHGGKRRNMAKIAAFVAVCALLLGGAFYARTGIARLVPGTAGLYAALNVPVNLRGLEFRNVTAETTVEDGISVLSVRGDIVNVTSTPTPIPPIRFSMRDKAKVEIYHWTGAADAEELDPAGRAAFATLLASPPIAGEEVEIRFDGSTARTVDGAL